MMSQTKLEKVTKPHNLDVVRLAMGNNVCRVRQKDKKAKKLGGPGNNFPSVNSSRLTVIRRITSEAPPPVTIRVQVNRNFTEHFNYLPLLDSVSSFSSVGGPYVISPYWLTPSRTTALLGRPFGWRRRKWAFS